MRHPHQIGPPIGAVTTATHVVEVNIFMSDKNQTLAGRLGAHATFAGAIR